MLSLFKTYLTYDPLTGIFKWKKTPRRGRSIHSTVGTVNKDGYLIIRVEGERIMAHRLAWAFHYGRFPEGEIDHRNGIRDANWVKNLRETVHVVNQQNQRKAHANSKTGLLGASLHKASGKYRSQIRVDGKQTLLGLFATPEEAHEAYLRAKRKLHAGNTL